MRLSQSRNIKRGKNFMALLAFNSDESAKKDLLAFTHPTSINLISYL